MEFLNEEEKARATFCTMNIKDRLQAVMRELEVREKPHKGYLKEKLESMLWDTQVLMNMVSNDEDETENEQ